MGGITTCYRKDGYKNKDFFFNLLLSCFYNFFVYNTLKTMAPLLDEFRNFCASEEAEKLYKEFATIT